MKWINIFVNLFVFSTKIPIFYSQEIPLRNTRLILLENAYVLQKYLFFYKQNLPIIYTKIPFLHKFLFFYNQ